MSSIGAAEPFVSLVSLLLSQCLQIYKMVENVKANKERCRQIAQRVKALEGLVLNIERRGPHRISVAVESALRELCGTLDSAVTLMGKFSRTNAFMSFLKSNSHEDKFWKVDKSLTDNFQVLSGALLIEQGDTLHEVYQSVSCKQKTRPRIFIPEPVSSTTPPMTVSSPTAPAPPPYTASPLTLSSPTTFTPLPYMAPTMTMPNLTSPMALPYMAPTMTMPNLTSPMALPYMAPTMTMPNLTSPMALPYMAPTMTMSPTSLYGTMTSNPFSTSVSIVSSPQTMSIMNPMAFSPFNTSVATVYNYSPYS